MKLLVVVLNVLEHQEDLFEALLELDVRGVTVVESEGVMQYLAQEVPIFAGLRQMLAPGSGGHSKIVFGVSDSDKVLQDLHSMLKEVGVDLEKAGTGYALTVDVKEILEGPPEED